LLIAESTIFNSAFTEFHRLGSSSLHDVEKKIMLFTVVESHNHNFPVSIPRPEGSHPEDNYGTSKQMLK
jgi:hypothetical protein